VIPQTRLTTTTRNLQLATKFVFLYIFLSWFIMDKTSQKTDVTNKQVPGYIRNPLQVQDDPQLPDDGGKIPKSQGRGWRVNSQL
jgi:hypothetical protein